jgi:hypothetical protein
LFFLGKAVAGLMSAEFFPLRPFRNGEILFKHEEKTG